jgi:hypothetical protein
MAKLQHKLTEELDACDDYEHSQNNQSESKKAEDYF